MLTKCMLIWPVYGARLNSCDWRVAISANKELELATYARTRWQWPLLSNCCTCEVFIAAFVLLFLWFSISLTWAVGISCYILFGIWFYLSHWIQHNVHQCPYDISTTVRIGLWATSHPIAGFFYRFIFITIFFGCCFSNTTYLKYLECWMKVESLIMCNVSMLHDAREEEGPEKKLRLQAKGGCFPFF